MKRIKISLLIMSLITIFVVLIGCKSTNGSTVVEQENAEQENTNKQENTEQDYNKLFELKLYSDKQVYKTTDKIKIWATLKYIGNNNQVKIWHGDPYIVFYISDGKEFNIGGMVFDILTSTVLEKDKLYEFDYIKSGGFSEDDPDADFWKKFYAKKDLYLPEGEYTVTARGDFSLSENTEESKRNLSTELKIKVIN